MGLQLNLHEQLTYTIKFTKTSIYLLHTKQKLVTNHNNKYSVLAVRASPRTMIL